MLVSTSSKAQRDTFTQYEGEKALTDDVGADSIDGDVLRGQLRGKRAHEADHPELGRAVEGHVRHSVRSTMKTASVHLENTRSARLDTHASEAVTTIFPLKPSTTSCARSSCTAKFVEYTIPYKLISNTVSVGGTNSAG